MEKVILIVLDSVGIGALPDAAEYGEAGCDTLCHIAEAVGGINLPNLARLGLGKIVAAPGVDSGEPVVGAYGRMAELSTGKDTTTGHWEIAGVITTDPLPTFPQGFPPELIQAFEARIGRRVLGNKTASGTQIIEELGEEHIRTGFPIVYTSADSVFQIAAHEEVIPLQELYVMCRAARALLTGKWAVGRVIARPFTGRPGAFTRTPNRRDYSLAPPEKTVLDALTEKGIEVVGVGKISDIFAGRGLSRSVPAKNNEEGVDRTIEAWLALKNGLIFTNLLDFDQSCGHRNDPAGYAAKLEEFDRRIPELLELVAGGGWLFITADHGNDPTTPSTDHDREYVPLLVYGDRVKAGTDLGTRRSFADIAATLSEIFDLNFQSPGQSFLAQIKAD